MAQGKYADLVKKWRPEACQPGDIVDTSGRILGQHNGIVHFTIGQRRRLNLSSPEPLFVIRLAPEKNQVIVGHHSELATQTVRLKEINWLLNPQKFEQGKECYVKFRSSQEPLPAVVRVTHGGAIVEFKDPEYGVSPGQACVFFEKSRVLGGGWITS